MSDTIKLTDNQERKLKALWFVYGNDGPKSTLFNHKLIQGFVERYEDRRKDYEQVNDNLKDKWGEKYAKQNGITDECLEEVNKILLEN